MCGAAWWRLMHGASGTAIEGQRGRPLRAMRQRNTPSHHDHAAEVRFRPPPLCAAASRRPCAAPVPQAPRPAPRHVPLPARVGQARRDRRVPPADGQPVPAQAWAVRQPHGAHQRPSRAGGAAGSQGLGFGAGTSRGFWAARGGSGLIKRSGAVFKGGWGFGLLARVMPLLQLSAHQSHCLLGWARAVSEGWAGRWGGWSGPLARAGGAMGPRLSAWAKQGRR